MHLRSVGITGTNGKTTTTTWLAAALRAAQSPVFCATTLGYFLDDEKLSAGKGYEGFLDAARAASARGARVAALELTSQALWSGVARAWPCEVGVFTNLSNDHLDAHGDAEHYLASKAQLFLALPADGCAVLNGCDPTFELLREVVPAHARVLTYGHSARGPANQELDLRITGVRVSWSGTTFRSEGEPFGTRGLRVRGIGEVFAENAAAALLGAWAMGVPLNTAARAIAQAPPPPGRFEVVATRPRVVIDYAHSPDAIVRTCATARRLASRDGGKLTVVFGAGANRDPAKRPLMGKAVRRADRVTLTTDNPRDEDPSTIAAAIAKGLARHPHVQIELDRRTAITSAIREAHPRDVVLVCGKGHEKDQVVAGAARHFSDKEVVLEGLAARR
jgi:UDP-N-acetylmuramoyl-L-alanyl-D-glutamate--2,6-diaminopimelate ligase